MQESHSLKKTLGPWMLWGLGVGYVISGMYFGWNLGLPQGGPFGLLVATLLVTLMYVTFVLSYAELSCAFPRAGGAFVYAHHALGPGMGLLAGVGQWVEFVFAPPAIAAAIGAYFSLFIPGSDATLIAIIAYLIFTSLNIYGVKHSAIFELVITILAVGELLLFVGITAPHFEWSNFTMNPLPNGWMGIFPAIPYAIWFYLAIEGVANVAEEARNPQKDLALGFGSAMGTLVVLAILVFFSSVGVSGWEAIVFPPGSNEPSDSPLPLAIAHVVGTGHLFYHLLVTIGLFGLIASFHGIILVAGRATLEFGRVGYAPKILGITLRERKTPAPALIFNALIGVLALLTGKTGEIITLSVFGALTLYLISMLSFFKLRKTEPNRPRPYQTKFYPWIPGTALLLSIVCLGSLIYYNPKLALIYFGLVVGAFVWFYTIVPKKVRDRSVLEASS